MSTLLSASATVKIKVKVKLNVNLIKLKLKRQNEKPTLELAQRILFCSNNNAQGIHNETRSVPLTLSRSCAKCCQFRLLT